MVVCGVVGLGCFIYGIKESDDVLFYASFGIWGAILVPIVFRISYRAVEVAFSSPAVIAILCVLVVVAGLMLLFRNMTAELLHSLLGNEQFVRVLLVGILVLGLLGCLGIVAISASRYAIRHFGHLGEKLRLSADLDHQEQVTGLELEQLRLRQQIELKKLELEQQQLILAHKQLEVSDAQRRLLTAESALAAASLPPPVAVATPVTGAPSPELTDRVQA